MEVASVQFLDATLNGFAFLTGEIKETATWRTACASGLVVATVPSCNIEDVRVTLDPISRGSWPAKIEHSCAKRICNSRHLNKVSCWILADNGMRIGHETVRLQIDNFPNPNPNDNFPNPDPNDNFSMSQQTTEQTKFDEDFKAVFNDVPIPVTPGVYQIRIVADACNLKCSFDVARVSTAWGCRHDGDYVGVGCRTSSKAQAVPRSVRCTLAVCLLPQQVSGYSCLLDDQIRCCWNAPT